MENETVRHKLWNPVPRKIQRTDDSHTNLMTNVLCDLIVKSYSNPTENPHQSQGNILQSLARVFLQNPQLLTVLSQPDSSPSNSTNTNQASSTPISKTGLDVNLQSDSQSETILFLKKNHSAPVVSDGLSHSQKIFLQAFSSQNLTENLSLKESLSRKDEDISPKALPSLNQKSQPQSKCKKCKCKNSKCLKLYCECLANGEYCGPDCGCQTCYNTSQYESARSQAISQIVEKNPLAFSSAPETTIHRHKSNESYLNKSARHKGCTCKKSGCNKKYCECFAYGISCGDACRCENCKNCNGAKKCDRDEDAGNYEIKTENESSTQSFEEESTYSTAKLSVSRENVGRKSLSKNAEILGIKNENLQSLALFRTMTEKSEMLATFKPKVLTKNISESKTPGLEGCGSVDAYDKENLSKMSNSTAAL